MPWYESLCYPSDNRYDTASPAQPKPFVSRASRSVWPELSEKGLQDTLKLYFFKAQKFVIDWKENTEINNISIYKGNRKNVIK